MSAEVARTEEEDEPEAVRVARMTDKLEETLIMG